MKTLNLSINELDEIRTTRIIVVSVTNGDAATSLLIQSGFDIITLYRQALEVPFMRETLFSEAFSWYADSPDINLVDIVVCPEHGIPALVNKEYRRIL